MEFDLEKAKTHLKEGGYTCVLIKEDSVYTTHERGVKPLLNWLHSQTDFRGYFAADKVVGKAAAYLYVLLNVRGVYAPIMSAVCVEVLKAHGIEAHYESVVPAIYNRARTGLCPMEQSVKDARTPRVAYEAIQKTFVRLQGLGN